MAAESLCVTRTKLQMPVTAEEHKRQETPTINPVDRQPAHLTDQLVASTRYYRKGSPRVKTRNTNLGPRLSAVIHGESSKRLATQRNTTNKEHLQSTQSPTECGVGSANDLVAPNLRLSATCGVRIGSRAQSDRRKGGCNKKH